MTNAQCQEHWGHVFHQSLRVHVWCSFFCFQLHVLFSVVTLRVFLSSSAGLVVSWRGKWFPLKLWVRTVTQLVLGVEEKKGISRKG